MDVIEHARAMGRALQKDERYVALMSAQAATENARALQEQIATFNELRSRINEELMRPKEEKDPQKLSQMDEQVRTLYRSIMETPEMIAYNAAKAEMAALLSFLSQILNGSANGMDPDTIEPQDECAGSCSSCEGCH
jgi:cell fate (sporulation/competence/biofilm development) regulator YlbF (YheA/YmcA/DUF963 family)